MGWTSWKTTKEGMIRELLQPFGSGPVWVESLKHEITEHNDGDNYRLRTRLWILTQATYNEAHRGKPSGYVERYVTLQLIEPFGQGEYGHKHMDETVGPFYYDCPLEFLDECTAPINDTAKDWRDKVRKHQDNKARAYAYV